MALLSCNLSSLKILFVLLMSTTVFCSSQNGLNTEIPLNNGWFVWNPRKPSLNVTANIPFTIHNRLFSAGILEDPYYRFNDMKYRWVATDDWVLSIKFTVAKDFLKHSQINLVFNSIDTVTIVYLNGLKVGTSQSKFLEYKFDVTEHVKLGMNKVELYAISPVSYSLSQSKLYVQKYKYPVLPNCYPKVLHGECHSNFIRKEPCSFGWDFGPSLPTQGLFGSAYVEGVTSVALGTVRIWTEKQHGGWRVQACSDLVNVFSCAHLHLKFAILEIGISKSSLIKVVDQVSTDVCTSIHINSDVSVNEWWPHQYGSQHMYTLEVSIHDAFGKNIHSKSARFGFRTVELVQQSILGSKGLSFYFKINGIEVFMKGSNWIPADALRDRVTEDMIDLYLDAAISANINVLRIWGGGGFEIDYFYEKCDRLGILIWQDFMFACAMYPTNPDFLNLVGNESAHQVKRLYNHPSIIVWSANNENEVALRENWYGTQQNFSRYKMDYVTLYVAHIKEIVDNLDKTRPFVVSSPSNGVESKQEGWVAKNPRSPLYGDVHHYDYASNCWNPDVFPKPRFASEYGYQSYPSLESLRNVSLLSDLKWNSTLMFYRQHHQNGNKQIEEMIKQNFKLPKSSTEQAYFKYMVYLSQVMQAVCVSFETEHYRRLRGRLVNDRGKYVALGNSVTNSIDENIKLQLNHAGKRYSRMSDGNTLKQRFGTRRVEVAGDDAGYAKEEHALENVLYGHTMGAMYWQLNDIWQAPSWASIEYGGKWKMLHYYAKNFFRDIALSHQIKGDAMEVFVISDLLTTVNANLSISVHKWSSLKSMKEKLYNTAIPPQRATVITSIAVSDWCQNIKECFIVLSLEVINIPGCSYSHPVFLTPFLVVDSLRDPKISISNIEQISKRNFRFTVNVQSPAAFLWLDTSISGHFSDNGHVQFEASRILHFYARQDVTVQVFKQSLRHTSLYNTLHVT